MLEDVATGSPRLRRLLFPLFVLVLLFHSTLAHAQVVIKVNDNVSFRLGGQAQLWADELQDPASKAYAQNLYVRRIRFLLTGSVAPNVTFFYQTDNPNLGKTPKALTAGFVTQDAWAEWKFTDAFMLDGGLFLVPTSREELTSTTSFMTIDISPTATVFATPTQTSATRDTGVQAKGYLVDGGRFEYRVALFQGVRNPAVAPKVASRNSFLHAVYLQYDFWEKEKGYVYAGTNRGTRKILALSGGYTGQQDYKSGSLNLHTNIPVGPAFTAATATAPAQKNEIAALVQAMHYDGGTFIPGIPKQNDYLAEFDYFMAPVKTQPFVKFEDQKFSATSNPSKDVTRFGAGLNYYVSGQNLKLTGQYLRIKPKNGAIRASNEFTVQMQVWYY
jgi:Phosphate-selective porin O and P